MTSFFTLLLLPVSLLALHQPWSSAHARQLMPSARSAQSAASLTDARGAHQQHKRSAEALSGLSARRLALANLLRRRRSLEASLRAPPGYSDMQEDDFLIPGFNKREEEWIWMPAHGYIPMPKDESSASRNDHDNGIGNLLRYG